MLYGLIGYPLSHTFSPTYFNEKFFREGIHNAEYRAFPLEHISDFCALLEAHPNLKGLNVTIPHKQAVMDYLDEIDEEAAAIGAVNTITISKNGKTKGYNTDIYGFEKSLQPFLKKHHKKALILGTGGAAKAVDFVLKKLKIETVWVSRTPKSGQLSYADVTEQVMSTHHLIVNTTPVGMHPDIYKFPDLPYAFVTDKHLFYDLVYNPEKTIFLIKGKREGAAFKSGLEMLYLQAERAWEIWQKA